MCLVEWFIDMVEFYDEMMIVNYFVFVYKLEDSNDGE